jgi:hypothetical protein
MKPVERNKRRTYTRLCLRIEDLERIYRLVAETKQPFDFEYGEDAIESAEDFDKLREMRKSAPHLRVFSEQILLWIRPWGAELEARSRTLAEGSAKLFVEIDEILLNRKVFWSKRKLMCVWSILIVLLLGGLLVALLDPQQYTKHNLAEISYLIVLPWAVIGMVLTRRVKIKWDRQLRFAPILEKVIVSVIGSLIVATIVFLAGVYLGPVVKPFLPQISSR